MFLLFALFFSPLPSWAQVTSFLNNYPDNAIKDPLGTTNHPVTISTTCNTDRSKNFFPVHSPLPGGSSSFSSSTFSDSCVSSFVGLSNSPASSLMSDPAAACCTSVCEAGSLPTGLPGRLLFALKARMRLRKVVDPVTASSKHQRGKKHSHPKAVGEKKVKYKSEHVQVEAEEDESENRTKNHPLLPSVDSCLGFTIPPSASTSITTTLGSVANPVAAGVTVSSASDLDPDPAESSLMIGLYRVSSIQPLVLVFLTLEQTVAWLAVLSMLVQLHQACYAFPQLGECSPWRLLYLKNSPSEIYCFYLSFSQWVQALEALILYFRD
ncbi:unnamed protein product [Protopolystoma xenopodis]|uniref:Uncharacterized protein n=1 Tax=Protopolystoma xenopodis TaxID=117903 RepID=A0A448XG56_9PLAT|nr:unnamed protein product [Protopolystoma xenopodis]